MSLRILIEACDHFHKTALFIHNLSRKADKMVIAYQSNIWLLDTDIIFNADKKLSRSQQKALNDIIKMLGMNPIIKDMYGEKYDDPYGLDGFKETFEYISEKRPDILIADYNKKNKTLYIHSYTAFEHSPSSSILIKKVVDALDVKKVLTSDMVGEKEKETTYSKQELLGKLPDIMYHGTSSKYAISILKNGLIPTASPSNYPRVVIHDTEVFLSAKFSEAASHAQHTVGRIKGFEVVFGVQIPDKNKLMPDYDIDVSSSQTVWIGRDQSYDYPDVEKPNKSIQLSRDFGIVGYSGRIPANFIRSIHIKDDEYYPTYTEVSKEDLISMIYDEMPLSVAKELQEEQEREEQEEQERVAFKDMACQIMKNGRKLSKEKS